MEAAVEGEEFLGIFGFLGLLVLGAWLLNRIFLQSDVSFKAMPEGWVAKSQGRNAKSYSSYFFIRWRKER
jgi:hypothetical protein